MTWMEYASWKKALCISLGIFLLAVELYLLFLAPAHMRLRVEATHLDKAFHIAGGIFLACLLEWRVRRLSFWSVLGLVSALSLGWEIFGFLIDSATHQYIPLHLSAWALDLIGDCAATMLGGLFYWRAAIFKND